MLILAIVVDLCYSFATMSMDFMFGRAESREHLQLIAEMAAAHPDGYKPAHDKLLPRMKDGVAIACPVLYRDMLAAMVVGYAKPASDFDATPSVEAKLVRTLDPFRGRGLADLGLKTLVANAAQELGLEAGAPLRVHLDTRNPATVAGFSAMGFITIGEAYLYTPDPTAPERPDIIMERTYYAPHSL